MNRRAGALLVAVGLTLGCFGIVVPAAAVADTSPSDPATPPTVSADALPTVQVDGVVWQQAILGDTVYAVGSFATARPAGAAAGTNTTPRSNILAYRLSTGELISSFAPVLNAEAYTVEVSPDGTRLYVGGLFTAVNGTSVWRVAALDPSTGVLIPSFLPKLSASVRAIAFKGDTVYLGGAFSAVGSAVRQGLAAVSANDGSLLPWAPSIGDGRVNALEASPDGSKLVVAGNFTTLNGSSNPGYGLGAVDATTGALLPFAANARVRNAGTQSSIITLASDGTNVYGAGYIFGSGGTLEGSFSANWSDGSIKWLQDCHGDLYSLYSADRAVYAAGHSHYCGNIGGFPETTPRSWHRAVAFGKDVTGVVTKDPYGYPNWAGTPSPALLDWFPDLDTGTYTGQNQGPWTVTGNSQYVVYGGEFLNVNNTPQQGLVRFAVGSGAPNLQGPRITGSAFNPRLQSLTAGTVRISWQANWDRDNENLTYQVIRDSNTAAPIYTATRPSRFYDRPSMSFWDSGLSPGSTHTYRLVALDPLGNVAKSDILTATVATSDTVGAYAVRVLKDGAADYWRLGEPGGTAVNDLAGPLNAVAAAGMTRQSLGAIVGDTDPASTVDGTSTGYASTQTSILGPNTFTAEAWFKTTSTAGGKIIGFGRAATGDSSSFDRQMYLDNTGRVFFGTNGGAIRTVNSGTGLNNGQWHHVVGILSSAGIQLYVDGVQAGQRSDATTGQTYWGYWRIGGDKTSGWPSAPTSGYLAGTIDEAAIYPSALSAGTISAHYQLGTATTPNTPPTAAFTTALNSLTLTTDASASTDPDGTISAYSWDFGDGTTGTGKTATHTYTNEGTYSTTLTVTDDKGATNGSTQTVSPTAPVAGLLASDTFTRIVTGGLGNADTGGAWSLNGSSTLFAVTGNAGTIKLNAGSGPSAYCAGVSSTATDTSALISQDKIADGGGDYLGLTGRKVGSGEYRAKAKISATGGLTLQTTRLSGGTETLLQAANITGTTYAAGQQLTLRLQVTGLTPTTVRAKLWATGAAEPASWQVSSTDSTPELQAAGSAGILAYLSSTATNSPVTATFDNFTVTQQ